MSSNTNVIPNSMFGVLIRKYGSLRVLEYVKNLSTKPLISEFNSDTKVIVKLSAASINPLDCRIREGKLYNSYYPALPHILGKDGSGVVVQVGKKVKKFKVGDEVFGCLPQTIPSTGTYCEYTIFEENSLCLKPNEISHFEAAALGLVGCTAYQSLVNIGKIKKDFIVFIHGGTGGVGSIAIQLAKIVGAKVYSTCSSDNKEFCKSLGADVVIEYQKDDYEKVIKEKVDITLDCVGDLDESVEEIMRTTGKIIVLNNNSPLTSITRSFVGWFGGISYEYPTIVPTHELLKNISNLVKEKKLKVYIEHVHPLIDVAKAHERVQTNKTVGKIVLNIEQATVHQDSPKLEKKLSVSKKDGLHDLIHENQTPRPIEDEKEEEIKHEKVEEIKEEIKHEKVEEIKEEPLHEPLQEQKKIEEVKPVKEVNITEEGGLIDEY